MEGRLSAYQTRNPLAKTRVKTDYVPADDLNTAYPPVTSPDTSYVNAASPIASHMNSPATIATARGAFVNRKERLGGLSYVYAYGGHATPSPAPYIPPESSKYQPIQAYPANAQLNSKWYIAYPAATVMNGGKHNLGLSEKTPQLVTRTVGGAGTARMTARPAFSRVQNVPRYNPSPRVYNTTSAGS